MENFYQYIPGLAGILAGAIIASLWGYKRWKEAQEEITGLQHQRSQLMALIAIVHKDNFTVDIPEDDIYRYMNGWEQTVNFAINPVTRVVTVSFMGAKDPIRMMRWLIHEVAHKTNGGK